MNIIMIVNSTDSRASYSQVLPPVAFLSSAISYTCSAFLTIEKRSWEKFLTHSTGGAQLLTLCHQISHSHSFKYTSRSPPASQLAISRVKKDKNPLLHWGHDLWYAALKQDTPVLSSTQSGRLTLPHPKVPFHQLASQHQHISAMQPSYFLPPLIKRTGGTVHATGTPAHISQWLLPAWRAGLVFDVS